MQTKPLITLLLCAAPFSLMAHNIEPGKPLPEVSVDYHGELQLDGDKLTYQPWDQSQLPGKVRVVQAIAGRKSAKKMNAPLMSAITAAQFPPESYQTTSIINQDDVIWGTGSFVKSSAQESKKEFPWSSIVLDKEGYVARAWQLAEKSSAILVLDKQGQVLFVKEGALAQTEIDQVLQLVRNSL